MRACFGDLDCMVTNKTVIPFAVDQSGVHSGFGGKSGRTTLNRGGMFLGENRTLSSTNTGLQKATSIHIRSHLSHFPIKISHHDLVWCYHVILLMESGLTPTPHFVGAARSDPEPAYILTVYSELGSLAVPANLTNAINATITAKLP